MTSSSHRVCSPRSRTPSSFAALSASTNSATAYTYRNAHTHLYWSQPCTNPIGARAQAGTVEQCAHMPLTFTPTKANFFERTCGYASNSQSHKAYTAPGRQTVACTWNVS